MYTFVLVLHIIVSLLLVLIVLVQPGKGADISSAFGGGAATQLFGASGPGNFLTRGTGALAFIFMATSVSLSLYSTQSRSDLNIEDDGTEEGEGWTPKSAEPTDALPGALPGTLPAPVATDEAVETAPAGAADGDGAAAPATAPELPGASTPAQTPPAQ